MYLFKSNATPLKNTKTEEKEIVDAFDDPKETASVVGKNKYSLTMIRFLLASATILSLVSATMATHCMTNN